MSTTDERHQNIGLRSPINPKIHKKIHIILKLQNTQDIEEDNKSSQSGKEEACFCLNERSDCIISSGRMVLLLLLSFERMARSVDMNAEYQKGGPLRTDETGTQVHVPNLFSITVLV